MVGFQNVHFNNTSPTHFLIFDSVGNVTVNQVNIIESQVFVYNLGTMYYIDDLLYPEMLESIKRYDDEPSTNPPFTLTTIQGSETDRIPIEINVPNDSDRDKDMHMQTDVRSDDSRRLDDNEDDEGDGEVITPRALPVHYLMAQP